MYEPLSEESRGWLANAHGSMGDAMGNIDTALDGGGLEHLIEAVLDADAEVVRLRAELAEYKKSSGDTILVNPANPPTKPVKALQFKPAEHRRDVPVVVNMRYPDNTRSIQPWVHQTRWILDLAVRAATYSDPAAEYASAVDHWRSLGYVVGGYVSGVCASDVQPWFPVDCAATLGGFPSEAFFSNYSGTPKKIITFGGPWSDDFLAAVARERAKNPRQVELVDNIVHPMMGDKDHPIQPWADYMAHVKALREDANAQGCYPFFNIAMHVGELPDADRDLLDDALGNGAGFMLERNWHPNIRNSSRARLNAEKAYMFWASCGVPIIALPGVNEENPTEVTQDFVDWAATFRRPTDLLFVGLGPSEPSPNLEKWA